MAVLSVDFFDVLGDDDLDPGFSFGVRSGFTRRTAAFRATGDDDAEAAVFDAVAFDVSASQPHEAIPRERFIVVVTDPPGRQFVRGNVVDERQVFGFALERLSAELLAEQVGIFGQEQDAALGTNGRSARDGHVSS